MVMPTPPAGGNISLVKSPTRDGVLYTTEKAEILRATYGSLHAYEAARRNELSRKAALLGAIGSLVAANTLEALPPGDVSFSMSTAFGGAGQLIEVETLGGPEETLG